MSTRRFIGRRSFLLRVIGGAATLSASALLPAAAEARYSDRDRGPHADRSRSHRTGITDHDSGATADPAGNGRGGGGRSGVTDRDSGRHADLPGRGRRGAHPRRSRH